MTFFDTNVVLDILDRDPVWATWSAATMLAADTPLFISPVVYAELAGRMPGLSELD